jgi:hypothetical protein
MKIPDKDASLFTDVELNEIIKIHSRIKIMQATQMDVDGKVFKLPVYRLDETYTERIFIGLPYPENELTSGFAMDKEAGIIYFDDAVRADVYVQAKVINWNDVLADCYEMIVADFRKWNAYRAGDVQEDITKEHLIMLANSLRSARGWDL